MKNIFDEINTREKLKTQLIMEDTYWKLKKLDVDLFNKFKVLYKEYMNIEENYSPFFNRISEILHDMGTDLGSGWVSFNSIDEIIDYAELVEYGNPENIKKFNFIKYPN